MKEDESSMLSKFFYAQWKYGVKNDWTSQVKIDLEDFGFPEDIDLIKMVKVKGHEYALCKLNHMKG